MKRLIACSSCQRHVRVDEASCPFCSATLPAAVAASTPAANPRGRSRAAVFAVRAALAAGAAPGLVGCGGEGDSGVRDPQRDVVSAGGNAGSTQNAGAGGSTDVSNPSAGSGGTINLASNAGSGSGEPAETDAGAELDGGFAPVPIYGGVFPDPTRRARV
jgi:hypothetical protein